ncbi:MAG: major capsid protein, partial [Dehalococcoidia bacterium]
MALTLAEGAKLSNDILLQGVIEETIYDSPVLQRLPFIEVVGNALTYNRENALPSIDFYAVGDVWAESGPTFSPITATLRIMGGDADVDNYIKGTRNNVQDIEAAVIALKAKALAHKFDQMFIYGDNTTNPNEFDGIRLTLDTETAGSQILAMGATGATLTLAKLDEMIDKVKGGRPDLLLMSKRSRRKIVGLARAAGTNLQIQQGRLGQQVLAYGEIPIG